MQPDPLALQPFRIMVSDAVPDDTVMMLPERRGAYLRRHDGAEAEVGETLEEYARRCVVIEGVGGDAVEVP